MIMIYTQGSLQEQLYSGSIIPMSEIYHINSIQERPSQFKRTSPFPHFHVPLFISLKLKSESVHIKGAYFPYSSIFYISISFVLSVFVYFLVFPFALFCCDAFILHSILCYFYSPYSAVLLLFSIFCSVILFSIFCSVILFSIFWCVVLQTYSKRFILDLPWDVG